MTLVCVLTPDTDAELSVALGLLDAYAIPYFVRNAGFGRMLPGLFSPLFNGRAVMVPQEAAAAAVELLAPFRNPSPSAAGPPPLSFWNKLRVIFEGLVFGWFVGGARRRRGDDPPGDT